MPASEFYGTEIFLDNKATKEYLDICRAALKRGDPGEYYEEHQIIPSGFWGALPWAEKGKLKQAMPIENRVSCKLLPEEHFRCHFLLTKMFDPKTPAQLHARYDFERRKAKTGTEYGAKQRNSNKNKDWRNRNEILKYEEM